MVIAAVGRLLTLVEDRAAKIVERAEGHNALSRRLPKTTAALGSLAQFATKDTERVVNDLGEVRVPASVALSLTSSTAAVTATTQPSPLVSLTVAVAAGGDPWMLALACLSVSWPYFCAAAAQGTVSLVSLRPGGDRGLANAAGRSAVKNVELALVQLIPLAGITSTVTAIASQLKHRARVRTEAQIAMFAGLRSAFDGAQVIEVVLDARGHPRLDQSSSSMPARSST